MHLHRSVIRTSRVLFLATLWVIATSGRTSAQAQSYRVTDLGVINTQSGQMISYAGGINSAGQVAGSSYSGTQLHAARFTNGVVEDLGTIPGGSKSTGVGINDLGQVAGDSEYSVNGGSIRHATLFSNGTATDLGFLPSWGNYSRANGINDAGEVVGHSGPSLSTSNTRAFIWDASNGMRDLGTLGGAYAKAFSINNSSVVTGHSQRASGFGSHRAFIWDAVNGMRDIGTIAGDTSSGAFINANGHVAGTSTINGFDNRQHAFLYDGTTMRDLGAIGDNDFFSDRSTAYGINIHDHVVGGTYRPYTGGALYGIPFIYRDGQMFDLTTLVDASGADYRLGYATGINDAGEIAIDQSIKISTNQIHAVLLTPIGTPPPSPTPVATPTPPATPTPTPAATPTPTPINISGTIAFCSNIPPGLVPSVTLTLTGSASGSTLSDGSGNYQFSSLAVGGSYTVTLNKVAQLPGSAGINTVDVLATQRHFLNITPLPPGCRVAAADVNGDTLINTVDVIAIQRFFLVLQTGTANVGKYQFTPANRTYRGIFSNQTGQNYDMLIFGDVAGDSVEGLGSASQSAKVDDMMSAREVAATVALPKVAVDQSRSNFIAAVRTSAIDAKNNLVGFQGDFTFDERVVTFQSEPVQKAGITGGNWNVLGNVLPGMGPIRTLRISAYSSDFTPLSGEGTLFELRMTKVNQAAQATQLLWAAPPDQFIFIDADLKTQTALLSE